MQLLIRLAASFVGFWLAILLIDSPKPPFVVITKYGMTQDFAHPPLSSDQEKQKFADTFLATFESNNPNNEKLDVSFSVPLRGVELSTYYQKFSNSIKRIFPTGCSTKKVQIRSRWEDNNGIYRNFSVFDLENCK